MKRKDGLDKDGRPMTIKSGVADVLKIIQEGKMVMGFSSGLHQVQVPGQVIPKIFQKVCMNAEIIDISTYLASFRPGLFSENSEESAQTSYAIMQDLERRKEFWLKN